VLIYQFLGYDPTLANLSPGTVLQFLAFKSLFAEARFQKFDFTQGAGQHKETFATGSWDCGDLFYFRKTAGNLALVAAHAGLAAVSDGAGWLASRLGVKRRLKRFLRKA
jgi:CelD/BcsL family acetyltransferase involved in cellulose biosynthesis